jgi:antibiotic biosynthesis monooxygenase (ABM) superfamily enzyme
VCISSKRSGPSCKRRSISGGIRVLVHPAAQWQPAKPYKQFLVTFSANLPLTILVSWPLRPVFAWWPMFALSVVRHVIIAAVIVAIMIYGMVPRYTRLVSRWPYR